MTTKTAIPNQIFGEGAPVALAENGTRYFDTSVSPYAEYVCFGGAWSGPIGGGAAGLPYTANGAPASWSVYAPYNFYVYGGYSAIGASTYGGSITLQAGTPPANTKTYGGHVDIYAGDGNYAVAGGYGGDIRIKAGAAYRGGDVRIITGYSGANPGNFTLINLPTVNPGGSGNVWNNAGVLNIT